MPTIQAASGGDSLRDRLTKATLLLSLIALLSRVLGFLRDAVITYRFGLAGVTDAYGAAIHVPDILNYLVAGGALSSTFVPLFQEYWQRQRRSAAWGFFAAVGSLMLVLVVALVVAFEVFTWPLVRLLYGHGQFSLEQLALVVRITRILLPAQIFFVVGGLVNGVLYSVRGDDKWYVAVPTIGSVVYNMGIIGGGLLLSSRAGIEGFAWGGLAGAFAGPFLLVLVAAGRAGARFRFRLNLHHPGIRRYVRLTLPLMVAVSFSFVDQIIVSALGTYLPRGSVWALTQGYRLMLVPVGVFGLSAATAAIGTLAGLAAAGDVRGFRRQIREALGRVGMLILPVTVLMVVLAPALVQVLLQRGAFRAEDTVRVASVLRFYALGMYAWSANYVLARGLYSLQDTVTPAVLGTITTALMLPLSWVLMRPLGADGLALATSIGISIQSLAIFLALRRKLRGVQTPAIRRSLGRLLVAAAAMAAASWAVREFLHRASAQGILEALALVPVVLIAVRMVGRAGRRRRSRRLLSAVVVAGVLGLAVHCAVGLVPDAAFAPLTPASGTMAGALLEIALVTAVGLPVFALAALAVGEEEAAYLWAKIGGRMKRLRRQP